MLTHSQNSFTGDVHWPGWHIVMFAGIMDGVNSLKCCGFSWSTLNTIFMVSLTLMHLSYSLRHRAVFHLHNSIHCIATHQLPHDRQGTSANRPQMEWYR